MAFLAARFLCRQMMRIPSCVLKAEADYRSSRAMRAVAYDLRKDVSLTREKG